MGCCKSKIAPEPEPEPVRLKDQKKFKKSIDNTDKLKKDNFQKDPDLKKVDEHDPELEKVDEHDPESQKVDEHDPELEKVDEHDPELEKVDEHDPESQKVDEHDPELEKVKKKDDDDRAEINAWIGRIDFLSSRKELELYALANDRSFFKTKEDFANYIDNGPAMNDLEKYWMIFLWITENISYNTIGYNSGNLGKNDADSVFRTGLAVCEGFSTLYSAICASIGLYCLRISGYAKGVGYKIGDTFDCTNHAWNVIKVQGVEYYADSTWSARRNNLDNQVKDRNLYWFMTPPNIFLESHFSHEIILHRKCTKEEFEKMHFYELLYHIYGFKCSQVDKSYVSMTSDPFCLELTSIEDCQLLVELEDSKTEIKINDAVLIQKDFYLSLFRYCLIISTKTNSNKFNLKIYGKNKNSKSQNFSFLTCFLVNYPSKNQIVGKQELEKLIPAYNLEFLDHKIKLLSHKRMLIPLEYDKLVMEFDVDRSIELLFSLKYSDTKQIKPDSIIVQKEILTSKTRYCLIIFANDNGENYTLQLFAKDSDTNQVTSSMVTEFSLVSDKKVLPMSIKELEKLIPAYNLAFLDNKIKLLSHKSMLILNDGNLLAMEFEVAEQIQMMANLKCNGEKIDNATLTMKNPINSHTLIYVTFPRGNQMYDLLVYSNNQTSHLYYEFAKFNILKSGPMEKITFLTNYSSRYPYFIYEPIFLNLKIGTTYKFKYYIEKAITVFFTLNKKEIYIDVSEDFPNVYEIEYKPESAGDLFLCAKYEFGSSYSYLCKYVVN